MAIDGAFAARRCSVLDISEGGAKIKMDEPTFVRSVFQLNFSRGASFKGVPIARRIDVRRRRFVQHAARVNEMGVSRRPLV